MVACGEDDNGNAGCCAVPFEPCEDLEAIEGWEVDIEENKFGGARMCLSPSFDSVGSDADAIASSLEEELEL